MSELGEMDGSGIKLTTRAKNMTPAKNCTSDEKISGYQHNMMFHGEAWYAHTVKENRVSPKGFLSESRLSSSHCGLGLGMKYWASDQQQNPDHRPSHLREIILQNRKFIKSSQVNTGNYKQDIRNYQHPNPLAPRIWIYISMKREHKTSQNIST